ncbi:hypothetical protein BJY52DRAFT_1416093 [Lactarius psammicola]|nr:hypothetical protein BJY52DRAFT_1416093 [Lactarius psammicola]
MGNRSNRANRPFMIIECCVFLRAAWKFLLNSPIGQWGIRQSINKCDRSLQANSFSQMPPTSSQQQTHSHTQNYSTHDSGYVRGSSTARVVRSPWPGRPEQPNYIPLRYAQPVTPHYDSQHLTQDGFRNIPPTQFGWGNDAYWGNSVNGSGTFGIGAPPPWNGSECAPSQFQYGHFGQGEINHTGFPLVAEPLSNFATKFSHSFPGTSAPPSYQGAPPAWTLSNCWVPYETQDELHLTIVFRRVPST